MRKRINVNAVCNGVNYKESRQAHLNALQRNHDNLKVESKCPYVKCFGKLMPLTASEVNRIKNTVEIIWK